MLLPLLQCLSAILYNIVADNCTTPLGTGPRRRSRSLPTLSLTALCTLHKTEASSQKAHGLRVRVCPGAVPPAEAAPAVASAAPPGGSGGSEDERAPGAPAPRASHPGGDGIAAARARGPERPPRGKECWGGRLSCVSLHN